MNTIEYFHTKTGSAWLWTAILAGPILWFLNQQVNLVLVPWVCRSGAYIALHGVTLACLLLTAAAGLIAFRNLRRIRQSHDSGSEPTFSRIQFMSLLGVMVSGLFVLVILAQGLPNFILDACQR